jgi:hypothetical protein
MTEELPTNKENFLAEIEVMDLTPIKDKQFMVAVGTGAPDKVRFLCTTVHGPYSFVEMLQEVGDMWQNHQHHAKVIVLEKDSSKKVEILEPNTVDYIECHYVDLITEEMLGGVFDKKYTCRAGVVGEEHSSDPRHQTKELEPTEDADE